MDSFGDDKISRLLRLKRYEQPPPGYFKNFLYDFHHRRQRDHLQHAPLSSVCIDGARDFVFRHNVRPLACYSAGMAIALGCAAVILITLYQQPNTTQLAVQGSPVPNAPPNTEKQLDFALPVFDATLDMQPVSESGNVWVVPVDSFRSAQPRMGLGRRFSPATKFERRSQASSCVYEASLRVISSSFACMALRSARSSGVGNITCTATSGV